MFGSSHAPAVVEVTKKWLVDSGLGRNVQSPGNPVSLEDFYSSPVHSCNC